MPLNTKCFLLSVIMTDWVTLYANCHHYRSLRCSKNVHTNTRPYNARIYVDVDRLTHFYLFYLLFFFFDVVDVFVRANSLFARFSLVSLSLSQFFVLATTVLDFFCSALSVRCNTTNLFGRSIGHPSPTPPVRLSVATFHIFVILFVYRHRPFAPFQSVCLCFCWSSSSSGNRMTDWQSNRVTMFANIFYLRFLFILLCFVRRPSSLAKYAFNRIPKISCSLKYFLEWWVGNFAGYLSGANKVKVDSFSQKHIP